MGLQLLATSSASVLKNLKGMRNKDLNPWPSVIMLLVLIVVGIICVILK